MKGIIKKGSKTEYRINSVLEDLQKKADSGRFCGLTLAELQCIVFIGKELVKTCVASTIVKNVADYFKSFGFKVVMDFDNVNYVIVA